MGREEHIVQSIVDGCSRKAGGPSLLPGVISCSSLSRSETVIVCRMLKAWNTSMRAFRGSPEIVRAGNVLNHVEMKKVTVVNSNLKFGGRLPSTQPIVFPGCPGRLGLKGLRTSAWGPGNFSSESSPARNFNKFIYCIHENLLKKLAHLLWWSVVTNSCLNFV